MSDVTLESLMEAWWEYKQRNLYSMQPARIVQVRDMGELRVDVELLINSVFPGFIDDVACPPILHVPLWMPSFDSSAITFPVQQGTPVMCLFSQRCLDKFKGGSTTPEAPLDLRTFDKRDAVAIPGLWPFEQSINQATKRTLPHSTEDMVVAHNIGTPLECEVRLKNTGAIEITSATQVSVKAQTADVTALASATITAPLVGVVAATSVAVTSPTFTWNGHQVAIVP